MSKETKQAEKVTKVDLLVSKAEFGMYKSVQNMGAYNMLDPRAREMTGLNKEQYTHILKNYGYLQELYG